MFRKITANYCVLAIVAFIATTSQAQQTAIQPATVLGVEGSQFTVNGKPTFLLGISYYGALGASEEAMKRDFADMKQFGFNWIRVWAVWASFGKDVSAFDGNGEPRSEFLAKLKWLVAECDRQGIIVDVSFSRGNGVSGPARLQSLESHRRAVETVARELKAHQNWYLDLANERNIRDQRFVSFEELKVLRDAVKAIDSDLLITASSGGDISREELGEYLSTVQVDFISPHGPRDPDSPMLKEAKAKEYRTWMEGFQRVVPLHYQEPFRRGYSPQHWEPPTDAFLTDLKQARTGGAAGWCLHNGDQKDKPESRPRRSFDLGDARLFDQLDATELEVVKRIAM